MPTPSPLPDKTILEMAKKKDQEKDDFGYVQYKMDQEEFHYCFNDYSDFSEIKDERFHKLRLAYLKAAKELEDYVNKKAEQ